MPAATVIYKKNFVNYWNFCCAGHLLKACCDRFGNEITMLSLPTNDQSKSDQCCWIILSCK